jgi:MtN3 and saliva related transmembrane protein
MTDLEIFGLTATCVTTFSFVPQVWNTWKTKDVSGISLSSYLILTFGLGMWLVYGLMIGDLPITVANAAMVCLTGAIVAMKIVFSRPKPEL